MLVDIKGPHLDLFVGKGQQPSHGTGGGAWAKRTNAKGGVTKKVKEHLVLKNRFFALYRAP